MDIEPIPACPECEGDGCKTCLGTGLTPEDVNLDGLARHLSLVSSPLPIAPVPARREESPFAQKPGGRNTPATAMPN